MRFAAYVRISSEDQVGNYSIVAQQRAIENWVQARQGTVVKVYIDEAESGTTFDRPAFLEMRRAAQKQEFDAIVVFKFDRFARNYTESLAVKSLLRHEYGIKVFSVLEESEDSDGASGILVENMMGSAVDLYSRIVSIDTAKGKRERARQGYHNNRPPFGMDKTKEGILYPNEVELKGLLLAFELYATGEYSDKEIAKILNDTDYTSKTGSRFSTDTVRDMLQNRTYLGYIKYQPYQRNADGSRSYDADIEWFEGKHDAIIPQEIFDKCQEVRKVKATHHKYYPKHRIYLLNNIIYCAECVESKPTDVVDDKYGKMRSESNADHNYYRCRASDFSRICSQRTTRADFIEEQLVTLLKNLKLPIEWREKVIVAVSRRLGDKRTDERLAEINTIIERMDFRWDNNLITNIDEFLEKRRQLQQEIEQLTPLLNDDLQRATDLMDNFGVHWQTVAENQRGQKELIEMIVSGVWIKNRQIAKVAIYPDYYIEIK